MARAFVGAGGDAALRLPQFQAIEQLLEAVAILGEIDGVGRGAEDRHLGLFQWLGKLQRRLAAELHDDAVQRAVGALGVDDLEHVLVGERLEIKPVRGVVIRRHRLRIAIDHDGLVADVLEREGGVAAAIIELDALADAVRAAAEDDDFLLVGRRRLIDGAAGERHVVGRIHIGRGGSEFGGAGVDALEHRPHAEVVALLRYGCRGLAGELGEPGIGKAHRLEPAQRAGFPVGSRFARISASVSTMPRICAKNHGSIRQAV